ncbi:MAG: phage major capsid protein [Alphaproteobacteria bacterium]
MASKDLLQKRSKIIADMRSIADQPKGENGDLSEDQATRFDEMRAELLTVEKGIERQKALDDAERRMVGETITGTGDDRLDAETRNFSLLKAIASQCPDIAPSVDAGRELELSAELQRRSGRKAQGIMAPMSIFQVPIEKRVVTTALPSGGEGANFIGTDHRADQFIDILRARLVVRRLGATVLSGLVGNVDIPKRSGSSSVAWVAENSAITPADFRGTKVQLTPKHVGGITEVSRNMLLQSSPDVEQLMRSDFAALLAQAIDSAALVGGGSNEPDGILSISNVPTEPTAGSPASLSWAQILSMIATVEAANADMGSLAWAANPYVVKVARDTTKVASDAGAGFIVDDPNSMAGFPLARTTLLPGAPGVSPDQDGALIFGNWQDLLLGYWSEFDLLVNPYESTAYTKGNVQVRGMATADVQVRHVEAFVFSDDIPVD